MADQYSLKTLAALMQAPEAELHRVLRSASVPCQDGMYPLVQGIQAYIGWLRESSVQSQDARLKKAKADAAEIELERRRGGIVPFSEVEKMIRSITGIMYGAIEVVQDEDDRQRVAEHFSEHLAAIAGIGTGSEEPCGSNAGGEARAAEAPEMG